jgi:hypothetical protein
LRLKSRAMVGPLCNAQQVSLGTIFFDAVVYFYSCRF